MRNLSRVADCTCDAPLNRLICAAYQVQYAAHSHMDMFLKVYQFEVFVKIGRCGSVLLWLALKLNLDLPSYVYYVPLFTPSSGSNFEEFRELLKWGHKKSKIRVNEMSKIRVLLISLRR